MDWSIPTWVPHSAIRVARRSLVLSAVACRGTIEAGVGDACAEALYERIPDWLTLLDLWSEVEPSESTILLAPLGSLEAEDVIQAMWYVEGLAVLAWALKRLEFPKYGEQVDGPTVTDALWFLSEAAEDVITEAELRSLAELEACRELFYAIHCRLRDYARHRDPKDISDWVDESWLNTLSLNASELFARGDLAIDGKPISEVTEERLQEMESIIRERHRAIIWLVEGYAIYAQTPVDT